MINILALIVAIATAVTPSLTQSLHVPTSPNQPVEQDSQNPDSAENSGFIEALSEVIGNVNPFATGGCPESGCPPPPPPDPDEDDIDWGGFPTYWCGDNNYNHQCAPIVPVGEPFNITAITTYSGLPLEVTVETPDSCSYEDGAVTVFRETTASGTRGFNSYEPSLYTESPNACRLSLTTTGNDEWLPVTNGALTLIAGTPQHVEITISRDGVERGADEPARVGDTVRVRTWFGPGIRIRGGGSFSGGEGRYSYTVPSCRTIVETVGGLMTLAMDVEPDGAGCVGEFVIPEPDLAMRDRFVTTEAGCQDSYGEFDYGGSVWDLAFYVNAIPEYRARAGRASRLPLPAYVDEERETSVPNSCYDASNRWTQLVNRQGINSAVFLQSFEVREDDRADHPFSSSDSRMISWDLRDWGAERFSVNSDWTLPLQNLSDFVDIYGNRCITDLSLWLMFGDDIFNDPPQYYTVVVPDEQCTEITLHIPGPALADLAGDLSEEGTLYVVIGGTQLYLSFDLAASDESPRADGAAAVLLSDISKVRYITEGSRWTPEFYVGTQETCELTVRNGSSRDPRSFSARSDARGICAYDIAWEDLPSDAPWYSGAQRVRNFELSTSRLGQTDIGWSAYSDYLRTVAPPELPTFTSVEEGDDGSLSFIVDPGTAPLLEVQVALEEIVEPTFRSLGPRLSTSSISPASTPEDCDIEIITADGEALYAGGEEFEPFSVICPEGTDPEEVIVSSVNASGAVVSGTLADSLAAPTTSGSLRIVGSSRVDGALRIDPGFSWSGARAEFQWYRCDDAVTSLTEGDSAPSGCEAVEGSDSLTRYLDEGDYGTYSLVSIAIENEHGGQRLFSPTTSKIVGMAPRIWGDAPSINGTPALRRPLTANAGEWRGWPEPSVKYSWLRCRRPGDATTSFPSGCRVISRSRGARYLPNLGDMRSYIRVAVTVRNEYGSSTYYSEATEKVGRR